MAEQDWLGWLGFVINLTLSAIICYGIYVVYGKRHQVQLVARHFVHLLIELTWSILLICIECSLQLFDVIMPSFVKRFLNTFFIIILLSIFLLRWYIILFDYHSGLALLNLITNHDDSTFDRDYWSWFLEKRLKYGSIKYLLRFAIPEVMVFLCLILLCYMFIKTTMVWAIILAIYSLLIIASVIIAFKFFHFNQFNDSFHIRQEMVIKFWIFASVLIVMAIIPLFDSIKPVQLVLIEMYAILISISCYISIFWVSNKLNQDEKTYSFTKQLLSHNDNDNDIDNIETKQFLSHLVKEMCVQNIFFLSDIMAYKQAFVENGKLDKVNGFECCVGGKLSRLVFRRSFTHYAWAISKTYIDANTVMHVGAISQHKRNRCTENLFLLSPHDETNSSHTELFMELHQQFDECAEEVWRAVKESSARFNVVVNTEFLVFGYIREFQLKVVLFQQIPIDIIKTIIFFANSSAK